MRMREMSKTRRRRYIVEKAVEGFIAFVAVTGLFFCVAVIAELLCMACGVG